MRLLHCPLSFSTEPHSGFQAPALTDFDASICTVFGGFCSGVQDPNEYVNAAIDIYPSRIMNHKQVFCMLLESRPVF